MPGISVIRKNVESCAADVAVIIISIEINL
jgi:hypothetical protein